MMMLCGSADILRALAGSGGGYGAWPELAGRVEQRAAQVLQQPQAVAGHGQATPAAGGAVQHGPDQAQAAGLAEGPLDEVRMPDAVVVPGGEPQVGGQALTIGEQALHRRRGRSPSS